MRGPSKLEKRVRSLFVSAGFCEKVFGKNRAFYVDVTYKDVDRFRKGSVHEL